MHYVWTDGEKRKLISNLPSVYVGVWDTFVDKDHCNFSVGQTNVIVEYDPPKSHSDNHSLGDLPNRGECGARRDADPNLLFLDHGTHVAGIIAGVDANLIEVGINPKAKIWVYEMDPDRFNDDDDPIARAWGQGTQARVINVSLASDIVKFRSRLESLIVDKYRGDVLFVAAAGETGSPRNSPIWCNVFPACWSSFGAEGSAVISVIALGAVAGVVGIWLA